MAEAMNWHTGEETGLVFGREARLLLHLQPRVIHSCQRQSVNSFSLFLSTPLFVQTLQNQYPCVYLDLCILRLLSTANSGIFNCRFVTEQYNLCSNCLLYNVLAICCSLPKYKTCYRTTYRYVSENKLVPFCCQGYMLTTEMTCKSR